MSLAAFQRAMAELAASPALGAAVLADPAAALAAYPLTERELRRLASAAAQPGMRVNRMLYRSNRLAPLRAPLRHTCFVLGPWLRELMDGFWTENPVLERNAPTEVRRFHAYLRRWMDARQEPPSPVYGEVLAWEMACYELALLPTGRLLREVEAAAGRAGAGGRLRAHPLVGVVRFGVEPACLMAALTERRRPPYPDAPTGDFRLLLDYRVQPRGLGAVSPALADAFGALGAGEPVEPRMAEAMLELGIAFRDG